MKLAEAVKAMKKPFGPKTATELDAALGNWHDARTPKSRVNSLGRYMPRVKRHLASQVSIEIGHNGKVSTYLIEAAKSEAVNALAT
jgi:hypothetical protein